MARLGHANRRREQRIQSLLMARYAVGFRQGITRVLTKGSADIIRQWGETGVAETPPDLRQKVEAEYRKMATVVIPVFGKRLRSYAKSMGQIETKADEDPSALEEGFDAAMQRYALEYLAEMSVRNNITNVTEGTLQKIIKIISNGYINGLDTADIVELLLSSIPSLIKSRAEIIALTEIHAASGFGAYEAARSLGLKLEKEWVSSYDERTRRSHKEADGQKRAMTEPFEVGGVSMMYPGVAGAPAREVVNCRCVVSYLTLR